MAFEKVSLIVESAKWIPSHISEANDALKFFASYFAKNDQISINNLRTAILLNLQSENIELMKKRDMDLTSLYLDLDEPQKAKNLIDSYFSKYDKTDIIAQIMARLWAIYAERENKDIDKVIELLNIQLDSGKIEFNRGLSVIFLSKLYHQKNMVQEEIALLEEEFQNPQIKADSKSLDRMKKLHQYLIKEQETSANFSAGVKEWLKTRNLPWFEYAQPKDLNDPRIKDIDNALKNENGEFGKAELCKLQLLTALSANYSLSQKQQAFRNAFRTIVDNCRSKQDLFTAYDNALNNAKFDKDLKEYFLWFVICYAMENANDYPRLHKYLNDFKDISDNFNDELKSIIKVYKKIINADLSTNEKKENFCIELLKTPLSDTAADYLVEFVIDMANSGYINGVKKVIDRAKNVNMASDTEITPVEFQLRLMKVLRLTQKHLPAQQSRIKALYKFIPEDDIKQPESWNNLRLDNIYFWDMDMDKGFAILLYQLKTGKVSLANTRFWGNLFKYNQMKKAGLPFKMEILQATINNLEDDQSLSQAIDDLEAMFDFDEDKEYRDFMAAVSKYRDPEKYPMTYAVIQNRELSHNIRKGEKVNLEDFFRNSRHPNNRFMEKRTKLRYYLQTKNTSLLKNTINSLKADELTNWTNFDYIIPALEMLGMKMELELVKEATARNMQRIIANSWFNPDSVYTKAILEMSDKLKKPELVPQEWLNFQLSEIKNKIRLIEINALKAEIDKNWASLLKNADEYNEIRPNYYHYYWLKGLALYQLDRKDEALAPLKTYTKYAKDELPYSKAVKMINEIEKPVEKAEIQPK